MLIHKTYETTKDRDRIIAEMKNLGITQIPTEGLFIGKGHLLFDNGIPDIKPRNLEMEIDILKVTAGNFETKIDALKARIGELERAAGFL